MIKYTISISCFSLFAVTVFCQKAQNYSFNCNAQKYSFTGYMIGDPKPKTELQHVYYYSLNTEKAEFYHLKYSEEVGSPLIYIKKITVMIIPELKELSYDKSINTFYVINEYSGPENIVEEAYNCISGNHFISKYNRFVQAKDFEMSENQSTAFKKILNGIKPYVDEFDIEDN